MVQKIFTQLDRLAYRLQRVYMRKKITRERVSRHYAFFHPRPTGKIIMEKYKKRLQLSTPKVLVTGCFDVLHPEHENLLRIAKGLGGYLVVGVETDARVKLLKGPGRPINTLSIRLKKLRQLKIADKVISLPGKFNTQTQRLNWLKQIKPDILAVSASTPNLPAKRCLLAKIGGQVKVVLPHNPKISTSKMLKSAHGK